MPERGGPTLVALLADHLATGRFAGFELGEAGLGAGDAPRARGSSVMTGP